MAQVSSKLRRGERKYFHWCPACEELHQLPDNGWTFDGNLEAPTFNPSFRHSGKKTVKINGVWTGEWVRDASGNAVDEICHYNLIAGVLHFHADSTHGITGQVPLPDLPPELADTMGLE